MAEQLELCLFAEPKKRDPRTCSAIRAVADIGEGKALCGAYEDGRTWTNCFEMGHCTLCDGPY